jgi:5-formyltetrahydrofolate cyclo-ligase
MRDKSDLRCELTARRASAFDACPDAGSRMAGNFPAVVDIDNCALVGGYMPFRTEIDPVPLMVALAGQGARLVLPRMHSPFAPSSPTLGEEGGRGEALTFHTCDLNNQSHFETNKWGLLEPIETRPTATPTILLVPLLGFDRQGHRLGYGKGYYDAAIADLKSQTSITTIGLAFAQQEVEDIPTQPHDQRLDWIITENEAYRFPS